MQWLKLILLGVFISFLFGCSDGSSELNSSDLLTNSINSSSSADTSSNLIENEFHNQYISLLYGMSKIYNSEEYYEEELQDSSIEENYKVYYYDVRARNNVPSVDVFGQNDDILWPGQILDGDQFAQNKTYRPLLLTRSPLTLSLSLESASAESGVNLSGMVENPSLSSVRQEINDIITQNGSASFAPEFSYEFENIMDKEQLQIGLSSILGTNSLTNTLGIDWSETQIRSRLVFTFKQRAFSVDVDTPDSVFSASNSIENLNAQLSGPISPLYVSSVDYGAVFYMVIESDLDANSLKASLNIGLDSAEINTGGLSENTQVRIAQFGGSSTLHDQLVEAVRNGNGIPDIQSILGNQTLAAANAVPISYKLRYLSDHSIAEVSIASEYRKKVYLKTNQDVQVTLEKFDFRDSDGAGSPEGGSEVTFTKVYLDSLGTTQTELIARWSGGVQDISPNVSYSTTFNHFNPETDYIRVSVIVVERDAFSNDHASGSQSFYIDSWDGLPYDVDASGDGAASRITVSFRLK